MTKAWLYEGKPFTPSYEDLSEWQCFVYIITDDADKKYVGVKQFHKKVTRPPLKGRKNKRRGIAESDWQSYVGSSPSLQEKVQQVGYGGVTREILHLCRTRGDGSYLEAMEQMNRNAIVRDDYYNEIVNMRVHSKHLSEELKRQLNDN